MLKSALLGGLAGGLMGTAMYGMDKAVAAVAGSLVTERRGSRQVITENNNSSAKKYYHVTSKENAQIL